jgi:GcrA cell cycle regulator
MNACIWTPPQDAALKSYLDAGKLSFSGIAVAINAEFKTVYSRNATIGRASRLGLTSAKQKPDRPATPRPYTWKTRIDRNPDWKAPPRPDRVRAPARPAVEAMRLRCVEIIPRHLSVIDLEHGDCRYPYGGDAIDEPITFCGHPTVGASPYGMCMPHKTLCERRSDLSDQWRAKIGSAA